MKKEDILVAAPEEVIFLLMHALLEPGDHIICTFPGYQSLYEVARSIGCEFTTWEPDENQDWHFNINQLDEKVLPSTKLIVANFPHNPTGYVPPEIDFNALVEYVRKKELYLLSDEMYRYLEIDEDATLPAACELYERAFSLSGLSKSFGLPGLRIGWIVSHDNEVIQQMSRIKDFTTICNSAPSEILSIIAIQNRRKIIGQQLNLVRKNITLLDFFFQDNKDLFSWNRPGGGSICFPRMLKVNDTFTFCNKLLEDTGILLVPSRMFHYGDHHVRIGFGRENLPEVLILFQKYLNQKNQY